MKKYNVFMEISGKSINVGYITGESSMDSCFSYSQEYLASEYKKAISISIPLQDEAFSAEKTRRFFDGLLPEGFMRKTIATDMHYSEDDYLSILSFLGRECLGAIRICEEDDVLDSGYSEISKKQVEELASEGTKKSSEMIIKSHLSLTGASGKVGLYYDEENEKWYLPYGLAPSTHIVKQSHIRLDGIVANEQLSMMTAGKCGIEIPESFIINVGKGTDSEVLFATKRYDRIINDTSKMINNLKKPFRLHQEDFAQALGISSYDKYEKGDEGYASEMFRLIRDNISNPLSEQLKLYRRIVFNYVIGNTDAHIKNYSLLYNQSLSEISLAPAYDIVSTIIYEGATREMSFGIGGIRDINKINEENFRTMASQINLGDKIAVKEYESILNKFESSIRESARELTEIGFNNANNICERIISSRKHIL